jgi:hypothetical protein
MEPGWEGNPGKACETELEVLEYGKYKVGGAVSCVWLCVRDAPHGRTLLYRVFEMVPDVLKTSMSHPQGMDVTKVRLLPRTGRRHQLRVHSMCLGHPIVGDFTYNPVHRDAVLADDAIMAQRDHNVRNTDGSASEGKLVGGQQEQSNSNHCDAAGGEPHGGSLGSSDIAERMMLHAHRLR